LDVDAAALAAAATSYVVAAVGVYGQAVLSKIEESSATATVQVGSRLLRRVLGRGEPTPVRQAVTELAEAPADEDRVAVLRAELRRAMQADPQLAADVALVLREARVAVTAPGNRAVAVQHNTGIVQTGDGSSARQGSNAR
jgi:hypothetical protein